MSITNVLSNCSVVRNFTVGQDLSAGRPAISTIGLTEGSAPNTGCDPYNGLANAAPYISSGSGFYEYEWRDRLGVLVDDDAILDDDANGNNGVIHSAKYTLKVTDVGTGCAAVSVDIPIIDNATNIAAYGVPVPNTVCDPLKNAPSAPEANGGIRVWTNNVALSSKGALAYANSFSWGGTPDKAIDGNTNGRFWNYSVTHNGRGANPKDNNNDGNYGYIDIELDKSYPIKDLVLWNRTDCCRNRIMGLYVMVSNTPFDRTGDQTNQAADLTRSRANAIFEYRITNSAPLQWAIPTNVTGRYIRVQKNGGGKWLSIAEIEVYTDEIDPDAQVFNYALKKNDGTPIAQNDASFPGVSYDTNGQVSVVSGLPNGAYILEMTNPITNCERDFDFNVQDGLGVAPLVDFDAITAAATANTRCIAPFNGEANAAPHVTLGSCRYLYSWKNNSGAEVSTDSVLSNAEGGILNGTYQLTVTDWYTGCEELQPGTVEITNNTPDITFSVDLTHDYGCSTTATGALTATVTDASITDYTIEIYKKVIGPTALLNTTDDGPNTVTALDDGTYDIKITNNTTGCDTTKTYAIEQYSITMTPTLAEVAAQTVCNAPNGSVEVQSIAVQWKNQLGANIAEPAGAVYTYTYQW